jgi:homocysteine S-methyltransferase
LRVQSDLLGAHALNIRNLFVTMGDPTKLGDFPQANDAHDIVPTGLMQLLTEKFNQGVDHAGHAIGTPCGFFAGCALNLTPATDEARDKEAVLLKKKLDCGAAFALTQPVFDVALAHRFLAYFTQRFGELRLPILAGILPLASVKHAEFFKNEVPGIVMPDGVIERLSGVGNKTRTEGARIAAETIDALRPLLAGVYLIPAFERFDVIAGLIEQVRRA